MRTTDTWTQQIQSVDELPTEFRPALSETSPFPYTLYTPVAGASWSAASGRVICLYDDRITLLEAREDEGLIKQTIRFTDIQHLEYGRILLHSWIKIRGANEGQEAFQTLDYNSTIGHLFLPLIERFRLVHSGARNVTGIGSPLRHIQELEALSTKNFKFYSYAMINVPSYSEINHVFFQSDVKEKKYLLFTRTKIPAQLIVLTDTELIHIMDEEPAETVLHVRNAYGAISSYIPLHHVRGADVFADSETKAVNLHIELVNGDLYWSFGHSSRAALTTLAEKINTSAEVP